MKIHQVNIGKEYKEQVDQLVADMKAYSRKQVWEECTCKSCKSWRLFDDGITVGFQCRNDKVMIFEPPAGFGCNQWEAKDE